MPGFTTPDGFIYEDLADQAGISLHGGESGTEPILAEQVQGKFTSVEGQIADVQNALDTRPGWHTIVDTAIGGGTTFPIPSGLYGMIRVHLRGELNTEDQVAMQVNGDGTAGLHRFAWAAYDMSDGSVDASNAGDGIVWAIARWGSSVNNVAHATIYSTDGTNSLSFDGGGYRAAFGTGIRQRTISGGDLSATRLLSSLRIRSASSTLVSCRVVIEGHRPL